VKTRERRQTKSEERKYNIKRKDFGLLINCSTSYGVSYCSKWKLGLKKEELGAAAILWGFSHNF
jgi:hypothetical protein